MSAGLDPNGYLVSLVWEFVEESVIVLEFGLFGAVYER